MSSELAMNAYVLVGNALHHFVNGMGVPPEAGLESGAVRDLFAKVNPMTPARIEQGIAALSPAERSTLGAICRYVILQTAPRDLPSALGLPPNVVTQTLADLAL